MAKLNWGMVGGGKGSQIGPAHRLGAQADGNFVLAAGALDHDADAGRAYAQFNVLCEKPMTMTPEEGAEIVKVAEASGQICAVNYCYSAYPMVREMRQMVKTGEIGKVRLVVANFSHGHHGDATDADNPRVR